MTVSPAADLVNVADGVAQFDGTNDHMTLGSPAALNFAGGDFTIESWIRTAATSNARIDIGALGHSGVADQGLFFFIENGILKVDTKDSADVISTAAVNDQAWHHVAVTRSGTDIKLYIDGHQDGAGSLTLTIPSADSFVGAASATGAFFNGDIDEYRIWSEARSADEIRLNYDQQIDNPAGQATLKAHYRFDDDHTGTTVDDLSASNNNGTLVNGAAIVNVPQSALKLDGTNDYLDIGPAGDLATGNNAFTYEAWIKTEGAIARHEIISLGNRSTNESTFLYTHATTGALVFDNFTTKGITGSTVVHDREWHHVSVVYDGAGRVKLFVDGKLDAVDTGFNMNISGTTAFVGVNNSGSGQEFKGEIGEVRFWSDARSDAEIADNFNEPLVGTEAGLIRYYKFDEITGTNKIDDLSGTNAQGTLVNGATIIDSAPDVYGTALTIQENESVSGVFEAIASAFAVSTQATKGSVAIDATSGAWTYTPNANAHGTDTFTLTADGGSAETITVTVNQVDNDSVDVSGGHLQLDGVNDYVRVDANTSLNMSSAMTLEAWVYTTKTSGTQVIMTNDNVGFDNGNGYVFSVVNGTSLDYETNNAGGSITITDALTAGTWQHVAVSSAGTKFNFYVNGDLVGTGTHTAPSATGSDLLIGRRGFDETSNFEGMIDDVRVWNTTRTAEDIRANYDQQLAGNETGLQAYYRFDDDSDGTIAEDLTSNNNHGTLTGGADLLGGFGNALRFDGVDDVATASLGTGTITNKVTIEVSVKLDKVTGVTQSLATIADATGSAAEYVPFINTSGVLQFFLETEAGGQTIVDTGKTLSANTWYNIAATYDGTTANVYLDGVLVKTQAVAGMTLNNSAQSLFIGRDNDSVQNTDGTIDNVRVWSVARTAVEIAENHNVPLVGTETGLLANYTFDAVSGGIVADNAGTANNATVTGAVLTDGSPDIFGNAVEVAAGDTVAGQMTANDVAGTATYTKTNGTNGSVVVDSATGAWTYTPNANFTGSDSFTVIAADGTFTDTETITVTVAKETPLVNVSDGTVQFDGTNDHVALGTSLSGQLSGNIFTIETWIRTAETSNSRLDIGALSNTGVANQGTFLFVENGIVHFDTFNSADAVSTTVVNDQAWHHVALTYDGTTAKVYVDGKEEGSQALTITIPSANSFIGSSSSSGTFFNGQMDEYRVWSTARSADEIFENYDRQIDNPASVGTLEAYYRFDDDAGQTTIDDLSSNNNDVALVNGAEIINHLGGSLKFDGSNDFVDLGTPGNMLTGTADFTVEAWIKTTQTSNGYIFAVGDNHDGVNNNSSSLFFVTGGKVALHNPNSQGPTSATTVSDGGWHHVAASYDGGRVKLYVDGVLDATGTTSLNITQGAATIGKSVFGQFFNGEIADVRLWSDVRTDAEISENYNMQQTGSEANLIGLWRLDETDGQTITDNAGSHTGTLGANTTATTDDPGRVDTAPDVFGTALIIQENENASGRFEVASSAFSVTTQATNGTVTIDATSGAWVYKPTAKFNGTDTFTLNAGGVGERTVSVTVNKVDNDSVDVSGGVLVLDGTNDYVRVPNDTTINFSTGDFTVEAWVQVTAAAGEEEIITKIEDEGGGTTAGWALRTLNNGTTAQFVVQTNGSNHTIATANGLTVGEWVHLAAVRDSSSGIKLYVNGNEAGTVATTGTVANNANLSNSFDLLIGRDNRGTTDHLKGSIDEVRVWNDVRTAEEIRTNYDQQLAGSETNLQAYYRFDADEDSSNILVPSTDPTKLDGTNGFTINGITAADQAGFSVSAAGDVNGDGVDDIIIGALSSRAGSLSGESYVVFGNENGFGASLDLSALNGTNGFRLNAIETGDQAGYSVSSAGDFNNDGFDDLLIGGVTADKAGDDQNGEAYLVYGSGSGFSATLNLSALNGTNGFLIDSVAGSTWTGFAVSDVGDVNNDGFDDIIVGAPLGDPNGADSGQSFLLFGGSSVGTSGTFNLATLNGTNGYRLDGVAAGDVSGRDVSSAGDVNGDGVADFLISSPGADPGSKSAAGEAYVVFGDGLAALDAANGSTDGVINLANLDGTTGFRLDGIDANDQTGWSVSTAGDVNGDGLDDIIIGGVTADQSGDDQRGEAYVVFGKSSPFSASLDLSSLDGSNGFRINPDTTDQWLGWAVSDAGDINADGFDDLLLGSVLADPNGKADAGESYVVFGSADLGSSGSFNLSTLSSATGFSFEGTDAGDQVGYEISTAGDINNDGFTDIIVAARLEDGAGNATTDVGEIYVVYGGNFGANVDDLTSNNNDGVLTGGAKIVQTLGNALRFDGTDDIVHSANVAALTGSGSFTYEIWFNTDGHTSNTRQDLISVGNGLAANNATFLFIETNGNLKYGHSGGGGDIDSGISVIDGEWHHAAVRYDSASGSTTLFLDGQSVSISTAFTPAIADGDIDIGHSTNNGTAANFFEGDIAEARIWNGARSDAEIADNYNVALAGNETGLLTHYTFDEISGGNIIDEVSGNNGAVTGATLVDATPDLFGNAITIDENETATGFMTSNDVVGTPTYTKTNGTNGTVTIDATSGEWAYTPTANFNGTDTFTVTAADGTFTDAETITVTVNKVDHDSINVAGDALQFDGTNVSRMVADIGNNTLSNKITVEALVNFSSLTGQQNFLNLFGATTKHVFNVFKDVSHKLSLFLNDQIDNSPQAIVGSGVIVSADTWYHVATSYDGTTAKLYVDGTLVAEAALSGLTLASQSQSLVLGGNPLHDAQFGQGVNFSGSYDEVRVWSDVRSAEEIRTNMDQQLTGNEGNLEAYYRFDDTANNMALDQSSNNRHASIDVNQVLSLDGTDDIVNLPDSTEGVAILNAAAGTVGLWFNLDASANTGVSNYIFANQDVASHDRVYIRADFTNNEWHVIASLDDTNIDMGVIQPGEWVHAAVSWNGTTGEAFRDGVSQGTFSDLVFTSAINTQVSIGSYAEDLNNQVFKGKVDEVQIWSVSRSEAEIAGSAGNGLTGGETNLTAYYTFDNDLVAGGQKVVDNVASAATTFNGTMVDNATIIEDPTGPVQKVLATPDSTAAILGNNILIEEDETATGTMTANDVVGTGSFSVSGAATNGTAAINATSGAWTYTPNANFSGADTFTVQATGGGITDTETITVTVAADSDPEVQGGTLQFDGVNDYVEISETALNGLTAGTIETWIYLNRNTGEMITVKQHDGVNTTAAFSIGSFASSGGGFQAGDAGRVYFHGQNGVTQAQSTATISTGGWHHVAVTFNGTEAKFYIDGSLDSTTSGNYSVPSLSGASATTLGAWDLGGTFNAPLDGQLEEVRIWNDVRTAQEIASNYDKSLGGSESNLTAYYKMDDAEGNTVKDSTSNNNDGLIAQEPTFGPSGDVLTLTQTDNLQNGNEQYVQATIGTGVFSNKITMSTWVNFKDKATQYNFLRLSDDQGDDDRFVAEFKTDGELGFFVDGAGVTNSSITTSGLALSANQWYHVTMTYDGSAASGSNTKIYVNGDLAGQGGVPNTNFLDTGQDSHLRIGADAVESAGGTFATRAFMDDTQIWDTALTPEQVKQVMAGDVGVNTSNLIVNYTYDDVATTVQDNANSESSSNQNDGTLVGGATVTDSGSGSAVFVPHFANALKFDGTNDEVALSSTGPLGGSARTVMLWAKSASDANQTFVSWGSTSGIGQAFAFGLNGVGIGSKGVSLDAAHGVVTYQSHTPVDDGQ